MQRILVRRAVKILTDDIGGEWVLLGGALAILEFGVKRATEDIDLASLKGGEEDRARLFDVADRLGLSIEAVNSAADYFLRKFPGWRRELVVLGKGKKGTVYRPTRTLFLALKLSRGTQADLSDCAAALKKKNVEAVDWKRLNRWLEKLEIELNEAARAFVDRHS